MKTNAITLYCVETKSGKVLNRCMTHKSAGVYLKTMCSPLGKKLVGYPRIVARRFVATSKP